MCNVKHKSAVLQTELGNACRRKILTQHGDYSNLRYQIRKTPVIGNLEFALRNDTMTCNRTNNL